ncbi:hypothetical protein [Abiotrophia defectiva]|jgi:hypothetical protein|uniref:hypothetical protein n=1 Tax=Abiotrophia defectiva TaxID=46125 RepID=UPI0028D6D2BA|nr:hypothetical protein [Abiotrophia defectiva]
MNILVTGNTRYLTREFIQEAFPDMRVIILGACDLKSSYRQRLTVLSPDNKDWALEEIFDTYDIDQVVFFSNFLTLHSQEVGEGESLQQLLTACKTHKIQRFCYLEGPQAGYQDKQQGTQLAQSYEQLCLFEGHDHGVAVKVIRLPHLYADHLLPDYLDRIFSQWAAGKPARFKENRESDFLFLHIHDLASLLHKVLDDWTDESELLLVPNSFKLTYQDLALSMHHLQPKVPISFTKGNLQQVDASQVTEPSLRTRYGWFPQLNPLEDWQGILKESYLGKVNTSIFAWWQDLKTWMGLHPTLVRILELLLLFGLSEIFALLLSNQQQFRVIDVRLLFIVMMAMTGGISMGLLAASLSSIGLLYVYITSGNNWITLFYDPLNWVPFVVYLVTGAMVGRLRAEALHDKAVLSRENQLLRDKGHLVRQLYRDMLLEKSSLKKQIMGRRDSYGRLYSWVEQLNQPTPEAVLKVAQELLVELVDPMALVFYQVTGANQLAAVPGLSQTLTTPLLDGALGQLAEPLMSGELWLNRQLDPNLPHYVAGLRYRSQLVIVIGLQEGQLDPMDLAHYNQLRVIFGLIEIAFQHALEVNGR